MRGIEAAQRAGIFVAVSMVVTTVNVDQVLSTGEFLNGLGIRGFYATKASPPINASGFDQYMLSNEQLLGVLDDMAHLHSYGMDVGVLECYPACSYLDQVKYPFLSNRRCSAGITSCSIGADGGVRPCSHSDQVAGNIHDSGLIASWLAMREWRDGSLLPVECRSCDSLQSCSGGCRVTAKCVSGKPNALDPYAKPARSSQIRLTTNILAPFQSAQRMRVQSPLRFREEDFGVLCATPTTALSPRPLTNGSAQLIRAFRGQEFSVQDIITYTGMTSDAAAVLCTKFIKDGFFGYV